METAEFKQDTHTRKVLNLIKNGKNLFVTGKAGTGKTFLLQKIVEKYQGNKTLVVLSPTGVAAENANGVNSFTLRSATDYPRWAKRFPC